jgi:predicted AlkP superfamily phosphohydrolase/phosphomutase
VYRREEVFQGPCTDDAPDLIVEVEDTYQVQEKIGESVVAPLQAARVPISANHQQEGMLAVTGAGLTRTGHRIAGANIADIAPTILYSLGLSIPADMDGTLVADAFREDVLSTRPAAISGPSLQTDAGNGELAADEEAEIKKRLRDLGYLE